MTSVYRPKPPNNLLFSLPTSTADRRNIFYKFEKLINERPSFSGSANTLPRPSPLEKPEPKPARIASETKTNSFGHSGGLGSRGYFQMAGNN